MALISEPKILFLDEPTLGLDVIARHELWDVIRSLKGKATVILTTHYMEEAEALSDRIGIMKDGKLLAVGTAEELKQKAGTNDFEQKLTLEQLAEKTGISKSALGKYETEEYKDMSPFNLVTLANFYGVSTDYLLGLTEQKNHPNADINNLHLSDDMIDLLESGKINTRLLCEIATHEDFRRFLTDIEIYVDRIADMRINDLNAVLGVVRNAAMEKCSDENDLHVRTLELAQVDEDEYFSHVIHKDLDRIISTTRENHKKDRTTADTVSPAADAQKQLQDALNFEGSDEEKKVRMYLNTLGIDYDSLTKEELVTQINILKKSKHMKSPYSQRGKAKKRHK